MILGVSEVRGLIPDLDMTDQQLVFTLEGIEQAIKDETNNDFRRYRGEDGEIVWPMSVKMGVINLLKWEKDNRDRIGVASETISRHAVTYTGVDAATSVGGYPAALMGFIDPYRKARFT